MKNKHFNFIDIIFNKEVIFQGNFDEGLDKRIKKEEKDFNKNKEKDDKKSLDKFANDFRDSFRIIKNALIKDNNLLEASDFHKYELYCKEIELKSKDSKTLQAKVDKLQLYFYRITSNHHTDLSNIFSWNLCCIAIFAVVLFLMRYQCNLDTFIENHKIGYNLLIRIPSWIADSNFKFMNLFYVVFIATIFICIHLRTIISLVVAIMLITINPKYILGIGGFISGSVKATGAIENILFVVYSIVMFLLLFSLQKTARKNSIVPH